MKVFNWVHRTFVHHNNQRSTADSLTQDVGLVKKKKGGSGHEAAAAAELLVRNDDHETKALLKHACCHGLGLGLDDIGEAEIHNIDGFWRDGILAIGTFGLQPLDQPNYKQAAQYYPIIYDQEKTQEKGDDYDDGVDDDGGGGGGETTPKNVEVDEENELNPLVSSISSELRQITGGSNEHFKAEAGEHNNMVIMMNLDSVVTTAAHSAAGVNAMLGNEADDFKKKGERRTLAELFMEDQSHTQQMANVKKKRRRSHNHHRRRRYHSHQLLDSDSVSDTQQVTASERPVVGSCSDPKSAFGAHKNTLSLVKKLIPKVTEDCRLARQLHHFMKKMLKRKIYPELQTHQMGKSWDEDEVGAEETLSLL